MQNLFLLNIGIILIYYKTTLASFTLFRFFLIFSHFKNKKNYPKSTELFFGTSLFTIFGHLIDNKKDIAQNLHQHFHMSLFSTQPTRLICIFAFIFFFCGILGQGKTQCCNLSQNPPNHYGCFLNLAWMYSMFSVLF